jgi:hypothetical protein
MNSCLYECQVMHARVSPKPHRFLYRLFLLALDLDELERLHRRFSFFSVNRPNVFSLHERDFLPTGEPLHRPATPAVCVPSDDKPGALKRRVLAFLATRGVDLTGGRVVLVTLPRVCGYHFNPVSFYYCHDRTGTCVAAISEVTNTFREMKPYFLGPGTKAAGTGAFHLRTPKFFYVSPYSDVDVDFDFTLHPPGNRLAVQIDDFIGGQRTLTTPLTGVSRTLRGGRLAWFTLKYPLLTLRVIALIHWHALRLWLKRVPWYPKAARAADQRELYRPHSSIVSSTDAA